MESLTPRQTDLVNAVRRHWADRGLPPSLRELADELELSLGRTCTLVQECEAKGAVQRDPGVYRSIRVVVPRCERRKA